MPTIPKAHLSKRLNKKIDFTDIPELDFDKLGSPTIGKFYRPLKRPISIRIDADVLDWFRAHQNYQKLINYACRLYMEEHSKKRKNGYFATTTNAGRTSLPFSK